MSEQLTEIQSQLVDSLMKDPIEFVKNNGIEQLVAAEINFRHLRGMVCRIYDINENKLHEISNANQGKMGELNQKSTEDRMKLYEKKIDKQKPGKQYYRLYAEGDSWFQFPRYLKDIIDWLNERDDFFIMSDAYGGDWITNIIYEGQYVDSLTTYGPDFFLISGGGNDLVGNHRLAVMVNKKADIKDKKYASIDEIQSPILNEHQRRMILLAQEHINKEFYALLAVFQLQYTLLFNQVYDPKSKHKHMISITQGYDYPIPSPKRRFSLRTPLQPLVNNSLDTGKWLYTPMMIKGILDEATQQAIMFAMIYEFNEMLIGFTRNPDPKFSKIYHVDSRGLTKDQGDWYDELHLKAHNFKKVAKAYEHIIRNHERMGDQRVVRSRDFS